MPVQFTPWVERTTRSCCQRSRYDDSQTRVWRLSSALQAPFGLAGDRRKKRGVRMLIGVGPPEDGAFRPMLGVRTARAIGEARVQAGADHVLVRATTPHPGAEQTGAAAGAAVLVWAPHQSIIERYL